MIEKVREIGADEEKSAADELLRQLAKEAARAVNQKTRLAASQLVKPLFFRLSQSGQTALFGSPASSMSWT
jgi:hypothetical protein